MGDVASSDPSELRYHLFEYLAPAPSSGPSCADLEVESVDSGIRGLVQRGVAETIRNELSDVIDSERRRDY